MSIKPLIPPVEALIEAELLRASAKFGERHHSPHEAYAVMLEEQLETMAEIQRAADTVKRYFEHVMSNSSPERLNKAVSDAKKYAIAAACEAIQLAAMCEKALRGYETEDKP